ncbi:hypothetical protein SCLCIDRAFT_24045 [Scleroderma citrinum Foug A]|uniref:Uncharacterized protein n=1 Tax=Scleroderma citrinum Foug A TaxID=1036808 RepID=A0A0C3E5A9_9AGAM|nr:hypothetical protein SCLCIDRAFT_24045 [Scleroderma citrinum Foug A]
MDTADPHGYHALVDGSLDPLSCARNSSKDNYNDNHSPVSNTTTTQLTTMMVIAAWATHTTTIICDHDTA